MREAAIGVGQTFSHSRLSAFESCPRKFLYRYVLELPAESESIEAFVGKRVHEVLERLYRATGRGHLPSLPQVLHRYRDLFDRAHDPTRVRIVRAENPLLFYRGLGEQCLENYYREHYPFDADVTVGLEERVLFELGPRGIYRVQGIVDRIARTRDDAIEIHDFKTSARVPSQAKLDADRQLALYQLGLAPRFGGREVRLVWHYLRNGVTRTSTRSEAELRDLAAETRAKIDAIRAERDFAAKPGPLCGWCEYRDACPASPTRLVELPSYADGQAARVLARSARRRPARRAPAATQLDLPFEAPAAAAAPA